MYQTVLLSICILFSSLLLGCQKVELPRDRPGPPGCGMRDPNQTAPAMLSIVQQETHRAMGRPDQLIENEVGGKDWIYFRSQGSVFGEQQSAEIFRFNAQGLLVMRDTNMIKRVGK
jgi:hypothetical protein